ncbi:unnamed protein product [Lampetra planeri]
MSVPITTTPEALLAPTAALITPLASPRPPVQRRTLTTDPSHEQPWCSYSGAAATRWAGSGTVAVGQVWLHHPPLQRRVASVQEEDKIPYHRACRAGRVTLAGMISSSQRCGGPLSPVLSKQFTGLLHPLALEVYGEPRLLTSGAGREEQGVEMAEFEESAESDCCHDTVNEMSHVKEKDLQISARRERSLAPCVTHRDALPPAPTAAAAAATAAASYATSLCHATAMPTGRQSRVRVAPQRLAFPRQQLQRNRSLYDCTTPATPTKRWGHSHSEPSGVAAPGSGGLLGELSGSRQDVRRGDGAAGRQQSGARLLQRQSARQQQQQQLGSCHLSRYPVTRPIGTCEQTGGLSVSLVDVWVTASLGWHEAAEREAPAATTIV